MEMNNIWKRRTEANFGKKRRTANRNQEELENEELEHVEELHDEQLEGKLHEEMPETLELLQVTLHAWLSG